MELIHSWVNNPDANPTSLIYWPSIGVSPINEYVTLGLLDIEFPRFFLDGSCDWLEPWLWQVYLHEFVNHLTRHGDHHFGKHNRFRYFVLNMIMRQHAEKSFSVFVKQCFKDMPITIYQLRQHIENTPHSSLANKLMQFGTSLRGARSYWTESCVELTYLFHQIGTPLVFFIFSAVVMYWLYLHALMPRKIATDP